MSVSSTPPQTPEELLSQYYAGDGDAFTDFDRCHRQQLVQRALRHGAPYDVAEDLASEVLIAVATTKDRPSVRWDGRRPLGPWLHRILRNQWVSWLRSQKHRPVRETDIRWDDRPCSRMDQIPARSTEGQDNMAVEWGSRLSPAINRLPEPHQQVLQWKYLDNLTHQEIGVRLNVSPATVSRMMGAAHESLWAVLVNYSTSA